MTDPVPSIGRARVGPERWRRLLQSLVLLLAIVCVCGFAMVLADRFPVRADLTATREHRLSPKTVEILREVTGPIEIVVTANVSSIDPRAFRRTQDVLDLFARASDRIRVTAIDTASSHGIAQLDAVLARLVERNRALLDQHAGTIGRALATSKNVADRLPELAERFSKAQAELPASGDEGLRRYLGDSAALMRASARDLAGASEQGRAKLGSTIGQTPVPALDEAAGPVRAALGALANQLSTIGTALSPLASPDADKVAPAIRDLLRPLVGELPELRDTTARAIASLDDLPRLSLLTGARALQKSSVALVIGTPASTPASPDGKGGAGAGGWGGGLSAIDLTSLFPPMEPAGNAPALDLRARAEELIAGAVASLSSVSAPILVLVHGESVRFAPEFQPFRELLARLALRGIDVLEWAAALDAESPSLARLDPAGKRPVVYVVISTGTATPEAAVRMGKLAGAARSLIGAESGAGARAGGGRGRSVMVSVNPSTLPGIGQPDPMVEFLAPLGIIADSGRVVLNRTPGPRGAIVSPDVFLVTPGSTHPVGSALPGLTVRLPWTVPISLADPAPPGVSVESVLRTAPNDPNQWVEAEWARFRAVPADQRETITNPPAPDSARDATGGPWSVAVAAERARGPGERPQRVLVVGSNAWFLDDVAMGGTLVNGQPVLVNPGNAELFEAAVYWLAGQDRMIAASAVAASVPVIPPMSEGSLTATRWLLIAGLPLAIMLIGAGLRALRG